MACYSNALRRYPILRSKCRLPSTHHRSMHTPFIFVGRLSSFTVFNAHHPLKCVEPQLHLICTSVACYVGYKAHMYEERAAVKVNQLLSERSDKYTDDGQGIHVHVFFWFVCWVFLRQVRNFNTARWVG